MEKERKTKTVENRAGDLLTKLGFKANLKGVVYLKALRESVLRTGKSWKA